MARGEFLGAFSMSEPNVGSDLGNISCRASKDGDGWVINGNKYWCTFADGADYIMLVARTSDAPSASASMSACRSFLIEKKRGDPAARASSGAPIPKIGYFGWKTWELAFDNCRLPAGADRRGRPRLLLRHRRASRRARAHTAARAIGLARGALDDSIRYARSAASSASRSRDFQAIRFKLAEMATEIEAARQLMYFVCDADRHRRSAATRRPRWSSCSPPRWPSA